MLYKARFIYIYICNHIQSTCCPMQDCFRSQTIITDNARLSAITDNHYVVLSKIHLYLYLQSHSTYMLSNARLFACIPAITVNLHIVKAKFFVCISAVSVNQHVFRGKIPCLYNCNNIQSTCCPRQDSLSVYLQFQKINMFPRQDSFFAYLQF